MTIALPASRFAARLRSQGLRATLVKAFEDHVWRRSSSVILEYRQEWGKLGRPFSTPAGLSFVTLRRGDAVPPLAEWLAPRRPAFEAMLCDGKVGILAIEQGEAVGCVWLSLSDHIDPATREHYPVAPGEAYHFCWLVDPDRRRGNVALPLCREVLRVLADGGVRRQFGVIDRVNRASYRIQQYFGYRECGIEVIHLYALHTRWTWLRRYEGELGVLPETART